MDRRNRPVGRLHLRHARIQLRPSAVLKNALDWVYPEWNRKAAAFVSYGGAAGSEAMYARAGEPKRLVVLKSFGHYEVYGGHAFRQVMEETLAWYGTHLPALRA